MKNNKISNDVENDTELETSEINKSPKKLKKEAKKAKKLAKKAEKNAVPKNRPAVLNPFLVTTEGSYYFGLSARAFSIAFAAFALVYFFLDTIDYAQYVNTWFLLGCCTFFTFPIVFSLQNKWAIPISAGIFTLWIVYLLVLAKLTGNDILLIGTNIFDAAIQRLIACGFDGLIGIKSGYRLIESTRVTAKYIAVALSFVFSILYSVSLGKKSHLITPIILNAVIVIPSFVCNILNSNWGTAFIFVSYTVIAVMFTCDKLFSDMTNPKRYDTETVLNPAFVIGVDTPLTEDKKDAKERKKKERKEKKKLLDDELDDLLSASKPKKIKNKAPKDKAQKEKFRYAMKTEHLKKYAKSAVSGFTALAMLLVGYVAVIFPASVIDKNFRKIDFMDGTISNLREIITAWLLGDDLTLDLKSFENDPSNFEPRSTDLSPRVYEGLPRFDIEIQRITPIYLRGWIANSYKDGSWYLDTSNQSFTEYRDTFGVREDIHESLLDSFLAYMNPSYADNSKNYLNSVTLQTNYGYVTMQVNIRRYFGGSTTLYTPSYLSSQYGFRQFRSIFEHEKIKLSNYFDGLFTSRFSSPGAEYAIISNVATMEDSNYAKNVSALIAEFNAQVDYIKFALKNDPLLNPVEDKPDDAFGWGSSKPSQEVNAMYPFKAEGVSTANPNATSENCFVSATSNSGFSPLGYRYKVNQETHIINEKEVPVIVISVEAEKGEFVYVYDFTTKELLSKYYSSNIHGSYVGTIPDLELAIRYFHLFTNKEKEEFDNYLSQYEKYKDYVEKYYTEKADSEIISDFAANFKSLISEYQSVSAISDAKYLEVNNLISEIIKYLNENYKYTLEPSSMGDPSLSGVENFIKNVKEGYCVQFASTLVLTLRELGIPARYVEGYATNSFKTNLAYKHEYENPNLEFAESGLQYQSRIYDYNEHSWVEVWLDGLGWVQFEPTPSMARQYNPPDNPETTGPEETSTIPGTESDEPDDSSESSTLPEESITDSESVEDSTEFSGIILPGKGKFQIPEEVIIALIYLIIAAFIALIIYLVIKRAKKSDKKKFEFIENAKNLKETDDLKKFSFELSKRIFELLRIFGMMPNYNEFPDEYRIRMARELINHNNTLNEKIESTEDYNASDDDSEKTDKLFSDSEVLASDEYITADISLEALEAEEFGNGMSEKEISHAAEFYKILLTFRKSKLGFFKTILYRYILNKV